MKEEIERLRRVIQRKKHYGGLQEMIVSPKICTLLLFALRALEKNLEKNKEPVLDAGDFYTQTAGYTDQQSPEEIVLMLQEYAKTYHQQASKADAKKIAKTIADMTLDAQRLKERVEELEEALQTIYDCAGEWDINEGYYKATIIARKTLKNKDK